MTTPTTTRNMCTFFFTGLDRSRLRNLGLDRSRFVRFWKRTQPSLGCVLFQNLTNLDRSSFWCINLVHGDIVYYRSGNVCRYTGADTGRHILWKMFDLSPAHTCRRSHTDHSHKLIDTTTQYYTHLHCGSKKRANFKTLYLKIIRIDFDSDIWQKYSKFSTIVCMLQFSCRFAFLPSFCLSNRTPKITQILKVFFETQCTYTYMNTL